MGVRGCGLGYDHYVPEVLQKKLAPMHIWTSLLIESTDSMIIQVGLHTKQIVSSCFMSD